MRIRKATLALLAIFCLTCAFAQRKVTPVESSDELKIVTKEELKVLHQRAKSVQMLSDSVLQDSLRRDSIEKAAKQVKYPLLYSTSLGVNFWDPIAMALGQSYGEVEVWAALNLRNRFIPIVEVGMGTANSTPENGNYTYKNKLSLYGRVGMNYNFMFKSDPKYLLFGGLRFGASSFNYDITNISYTNGYWGNQTTFDILNQKGSAMWMELVAGIQVELVKNFSMGWTLRYNFPLSIKGTPNSDPWYIPGYGTRKMPINIGLSAIYTLPLGKREEPKNVLEDGTESTTPPGEWKPNVPADSTAIATPQPEATPTDTITTTE